MWLGKDLLTFIFLLYVCIADSALTSSTNQDIPAVDPFAARSPAKVERSSEKTRPTVTKEKVIQSKSRTLDTAAVRHAQLPVDGAQLERHDVEAGPGEPPMASGKADRQSLKLVVDKVSHF